MNLRRRRGWFALLAALGLAALVALVTNARRAAVSPEPASSLPSRHAAVDAASGTDAIDSFLRRHWHDPLAPQGDPPAGRSALEASLDPQACGQCHVQQHADWKTSLHSKAMGPGIAWQLALMSQAKAQACLRCHAPLAEQKALLAQERGWSNAPATPPPEYVPADLHRQGLVCAACHVRAHERFGPLPRASAAAEPGGTTAHGGFQPTAAFGDSRFCATCHQFAADGHQLNGKLLENTYAEWQASPAAQAGQTCQSCHMPDRRHLWRGIHDPDMVRQALDVALTVERSAGGALVAKAVLRNAGAGHHLPTYLIPEIVANLRLVDSQGQVVEPLGQLVIGRKANLELTQELADTRLPAGAQATLERPFKRPAGADVAVELQVVVHPAQHYEALFRSVLARAQPPTGEAGHLLRQALADAASRRYELHRIRQAVPPANGQP